MNENLLILKYFCLKQKLKSFDHIIQLTELWYTFLFYFHFFQMLNTLLFIFNLFNLKKQCVFPEQNFQYAFILKQWNYGN